MFGEEIRFISAEDVRAYFAKNDNINRSVPLAVAMQVADEVTRQLASGKNADALELARLQGMLMGLNRFTQIYTAGVKAAAKAEKRAGR